MATTPERQKSEKCGDLGMLRWRHGPLEVQQRICQDMLSLKHQNSLPVLGHSRKSLKLKLLKTQMVAILGPNAVDAQMQWFDLLRLSVESSAAKHLAAPTSHPIPSHPIPSHPIPWWAFRER